MDREVQGASFKLDPGDNDVVVSTPSDNASFGRLITGVCPDLSADAIIEEEWEVFFHDKGLNGDKAFAWSFRNDLIDVNIFFEGYFMALCIFDRQ